MVCNYCHQELPFYKEFPDPKDYLAPCKGSPPKPKPKKKRLGTKVASLLSALGIKKKPGCGCYRRERILNVWGFKISRKVSRMFPIVPALIALLAKRRKSKRRKTLRSYEPNPFSLQEKEQRRQALLARQKSS